MLSRSSAALSILGLPRSVPTRAEVRKGRFAVAPRRLEAFAAGHCGSPPARGPRRRRPGSAERVPCSTCGEPLEPELAWAITWRASVDPTRGQRGPRWPRKRLPAVFRELRVPHGLERRPRVLVQWNLAALPLFWRTNRVPLVPRASLPSQVSEQTRTRSPVEQDCTSARSRRLSPRSSARISACCPRRSSHQGPARKRQPLRDRGIFREPLSGRCAMPYGLLGQRCV